MGNNHLTKTVIEPQNCLDVGGRLAIESYPALRAILDSRVSAEAAALFAEPLVSFGNDTAPATVSWYADAEGEAVPLSRADGAMRSAAEGVLSRHLAEIRPLLDDPDHGALVGAALYLTGPEDVWVVNGQPVLINWGMLPAGAARDRAGRAAHYAKVLGRYLPLAAAPPISAADVVPRATPEPTGAAGVGGAAVGGAAVGGAALGAAAGAAGAAAAEETPAPPPPTETVRVRRSYAWIPLVLFLLLAGGTLAWLLTPGTRLFPDDTPYAVTDAEALALAQSTNAALRERKALLEASLQGLTCRADGTLLLPGGRTIEGLLPPRPGNPADAPGQPAEATPTPVLVPDPSRVVPSGTSVLDQRSLVDLIEQRTVMVLAPRQGRLSTGSGFFVGPNLVVTNSHVIAGADPQNVYVTNRTLGQVHQAVVLKESGPMRESGMDFALLQIGGIDRPAYTLHVPRQSLKLQGMVAAGYPGDVLSSDQSYAALVRERDVTAVPDLTVTDGSVNTQQTLTGGTNVIVHSAPTSKGNSGGPLVDLCGRVVGVNTFVRQGPMRNLNFAISTQDLLRFLEGTPAAPTVSTQACVPEVIRTVPPRAASATPPATPSATTPAAPAPGATPGLAPLPNAGTPAPTPAPGTQQGLAPLPNAGTPAPTPAPGLAPLPVPAQ